MFEAILNKLKDISDFFVNMDSKIGFKKIVKYTFFILLILAIVNFKSVVKSCVELVQDIQDEIHTEKMLDRDELLKNLSPLLQEFRAEVGADRILYFEYHNSKENLVGIPFKYMDLVLQNTSYGVYSAPETQFKDINTGAITDLYQAVKDGNIVCCNGENDTTFHIKYPGTFDLFERGDGSKAQVYLSIPGINQPIGLIVLEWVDCDNKTIDLNKISRIAHGSGNFISRINGLIMSKM